MTKAEALSQRFGQNLDRSIAAGVVKAELALRALGRAAETTFATFQTLTEGAGLFKDLEENTGASAESIASLQVAASTAGVGIEDVAAAANKLTKGLVGVEDESQAVGAALGAIGLSVKEFKQLDPVAQYEAAAKALDAFGDAGTSGAAKVAIATALFGKNGAEQIRVMKALEEAGGRQVILTQEQIERSDNYADAQARSRAQLKLYAQAAASEAIPALTDLTKVAADVAREFLGVDEATGKLNANNGAKAFAEGAVDALAFVVDAGDGVVRTFQLIGKTIGAAAAQAVAVAHGEFSQAAAIGRQWQEEVDAILQRQTFGARIAQQRAAAAAADAQRRLEDRGFTPQTKPALRFNFDAGAAAQAEALLRKHLDGQVKAIHDFAEEQKATFDFANQIVKGSYEDGLSSLRDFYGAQAQIRSAALAAQLRALDDEAAAVRSFRSKASKPEDRAEAENRLAELARKRTELVVTGSRQNSLALLEEGRATFELTRRYEDLQSQIAQLSGDTEGASRARIAHQTEDARRLAIAAGAGPAGADQIAGQLRDRLTQTDALNRAQSDYGRLLERTANAEALILLAAQEAGKSENETLLAVGEQRAKALQQLSDMVDKANELALALGTPEAIAFAERLTVALKKATAEVDPLLLKIRDIGKEAGSTIANSFEDAILSGKKLSDVLRGLEQDIVRIVTRNLVTKPLGDYLSNVLGGNGQASGGGGLIGSILGAFGLGGGKALGGPTMPNTLYQVGERGPEVYSDGSRQWLLTGPRRGSIDPNPQGDGGGRSIIVTNHFTVQGNVDRRTQTQIAAQVARGLSVASARNN